MPRHLIIAFVAAALLGFSCVASLAAQDADADNEAAEPAAPVDTAAIQAIKESNPQTTAQRIRAALLSYDLQRPDVAKTYLQQIIAADPPQDEVVSAYRQLGSGRLLRLQTSEGLQPEGLEAANLIFGKLQEYLQDPQRLTTLINQLNDADESVRRAAITQLLNLGADAANPLLAVLSDPDQQALHPAVKQQLVRMRSAAYEPVIAAIESDDDRLVAHLVDVARQLKLRAAAQFLVGRFVLTDEEALRDALGRYLDEVVGTRPSTTEVKAHLRQRAESYLGDAPMFPVNEDGLVELWTWDRDANQLVQNAVPLEDAQVITAGRLLRDLYQLDPGNAEVQELRALAAMQRMAVVEDAEDELAQLATEHGTRLVEAALLRALKDRKFALGAVVACRYLGATEDESLLAGPQGELRGLALALQSSIYRVRWAAVQAVLEIDPQSPYAAAADFFSALNYFATAQGDRVIVIGELHQQRGQNMAGLLSSLQYEPLVTPGGRLLFDAAFSSVDVEAVFISKPLLPPAMMESVQILRKDRRTGDLPIGVLAPSDELLHYELRTDDDPLTLAMHRPNDLEGFAFQMERLYRAQGRLLVPAAERLQNAGIALTALEGLSESRDVYNFYDLLQAEEIAERQLLNANLAPAAARLLGNLATPRAQTALVNYASDPIHPLTLRQNAVAAFQEAVDRAGILLVKDQLVQQYDRYNASENLGAETQAVLAQILDIIEAPTKNVRFDQPALARP